jgi:hypothetical protein
MCPTQKSFAFVTSKKIHCSIFYLIAVVNAMTLFPTIWFQYYNESSGLDFFPCHFAWAFPQD